MKGIKFTLACVFLVFTSIVSVSAQTLDGDMNHDGKLTVEDVTLLVEAVQNFNPSTKSTLTPGKFTVSSSGKKVQFTNSNLYWDGSTYKFETNPTDYPTEWDSNHVGHFFWNTTDDICLGCFPYAENYSYASRSEEDALFCSEANKMTVEDVSDLFAMTSDEWFYLLVSRSDATNLRKYGVTVGTCSNCLIIAPDGYSQTLKSSYTLDEINTCGLVCLPAAGHRGCTAFYQIGSWGVYWSDTYETNTASHLFFNQYNIGPSNKSDRGYGYSIRLVKLAD